jgi:osmotically-inducible protein OsmY
MDGYDPLVREVEEALMSDMRTSEADIEVVNIDGIVRLKGVVESPNIIRAAEQVTRRQPGVKQVVNSLRVTNPLDLEEVR